MLIDKNTQRHTLKTLKQEPRTNRHVGMIGSLVDSLGTSFPPMKRRDSVNQSCCVFAEFMAHSILRQQTNVYKIVCQHMLSQITLPIRSGSGAKGRWKSILCTSYNSWFLVLKEHPICIPHWVFHPLCTAANFCPTCLEVIQFTKTFQSGRVFLRTVLLTCG